MKKGAIKNQITTSMFRTTFISAIAASIGLAMVAPQARAQDKFVPKAIYDFESNNLVLNSTLEGNDNWFRAFASAPAPNLKTGGGFNTTRVAQGGNPGVDGRRDLYGLRINDANWSFPNFQYNETIDIAGVVQADIRYTDDLALLSLTSNGGSADLEFFGFNGGQFQMSNFAQPGYNVNVPGTFNVGDWVTMRMLLDWSPTPAKFGFTLGGNHYNAVATLQYKNLTDGETTFTTIAGMSNIQLGSGGSTGSSSNYSYYSQNLPPTGLEMWLFDTSAAIDNIVIGYLIPEPTTAMLLSAGVLMLRARRRSA